METNKTILIAVPSMDQVPIQFANSIATLKKPGNCIYANQAGSLVYTSRNNLAVEAIRRKADYIFWLDSDMVFPPETLEHLLEEIEKQPERTIMTGLYCRRTPPFTPTLFKTLDIKENRSFWTSFDQVPDEPFEVAGCGFGCVLAPTDAFYEVQLQFGHMFSPIGEVGEDLSFCWRARQAGWTIKCDPRIELGHVGHIIVTRQFWHEYHAYDQAAEEEKK